MNERFANLYDDDVRADAYARLEFPGTYYLAYRDLPYIIQSHVVGKSALDFGCGAGRSTRFLRKSGFDVIGVDIAERMLERARANDRQGDYRRIPEGSDVRFLAKKFDLVLCAFPFDNIPTFEKKVAIFESLKDVLNNSGRIINIVSSPEIYLHEWTSFSTRDFPENRSAKSGQKVRIVMLDVEDRRPVEDILCTDEDYQQIYRRAGLHCIASHRPLGKPSEPYQWVSETTIAPWVIYVLQPLQ